MTWPDETAGTVADLRLCFEGAVPAVIATASGDGVPNVTYLSRVQAVDDERIALSNQFFSKTARNLAENPRASVLLIDPVTYDQWRLSVVYERTERRGQVFERLREDVDALAALEGMQDVFKLRAADIYRVLDIERMLADVHRRGVAPPAEVLPGPEVGTLALAELASRLSRAGDLDTLVVTTVTGLAELLGYEHSLLLLLDETGKRLYTIASHGYEDEGVGSEVVVGEGVAGMAAARCAALRIGNVSQMRKYSQTIRRSFEDHGDIGPGREIPVPGLTDAQSRLALPAMAFGELVAVLLVESRRPVAFSDADEAVLSSVAAMVAAGVQAGRSLDRPDVGVGGTRPAPGPVASGRPRTLVRFFPVDGSTFIGGDYLIKGVAGRILWSLTGAHQRTGQTDFTNREVRLDPSLELPTFRDNLESRLILLKRRLDERDAPIRIERLGRGRFRLVVESPLDLVAVGEG